MGFRQFAAITDAANGEVAFVYEKLAGQQQATLRLVAQVSGQPEWEQTLRFKQVVPVPATPAPPPKPAEPDLVTATIFRRLNEDGSWDFSVGVSTEDRTLIGHGAEVTFIGHQQRPVIMPFDPQGTVHADFHVDIDVPEVMVLVSISRKPWQKTVTVLRPSEEASVEVLLREKLWADIDRSFLFAKFCAIIQKKGK